MEMTATLLLHYAAVTHYISLSTKYLRTHVLLVIVLI